MHYSNILLEFFQTMNIFFRGNEIENIIYRENEHLMSKSKPKLKCHFNSHLEHYLLVYENH